METLTTPYFLLSAPELRDPNFARTVVLMGHHSQEGAIGWILNRVIEKHAAGLLPPELSEGIHPETPMRLGGPVLTNGLIVVHTEETPGIESIEMSPGLRVSSSPDILPRLFGRPGVNGRVTGLLVFGYAGWGPGQLEHEMEDGSWLVLPYDEALAFSDDLDELWERAMVRLGVKPASVSMPPGGVN